MRCIGESTPIRGHRNPCDFLAGGARASGCPRQAPSGRKIPYLAGGRPENLPNIDETTGVAADAVILATGDQFRHGIGYGMTPEESLRPEEGGLEAARASMQTGIDLIEQGAYWGYNQHCVKAKSDDRDAAQVYRFLREPLQGRLLDIGWSDSTDLYDQPPPTWAAGGFIVFEPTS